MADYYTQLSIMIDGSEEELKNLKTLLDEGNDSEDETHNCESVVREEGLWIYSAEAMVDNLVVILERWMEENKIDKSIYFQYSNTCSKPRLDAYAGGAVYIYPYGDDTEYMNTHAWIEDKIREEKQREHEKVLLAFDEDRRMEADKAFEAFDFGPTPVVESAGWMWSRLHSEWAKTVYLDSDSKTVTVTFVVRFKLKTTEVEEAYVSGW